ncbi:radical SAM protein [Candidatus Saccharibacteria bacterium]|nr:MAG: radical SAM protein [Candidatus Saccharibacteria bacterium]
MRYLFPLSPTNQQRQYEKMVWVYPVHLAMYATYLRNQGHEVLWGAESSASEIDCELYRHKGKDYLTIKGEFSIESDEQIDVPFEKLPYPDREFTDAKNPRWQSYGNYRFHPATHMMASNLCWYGKCTFCVDTAKLQAGEKRGIRSVDHVIEEIDDLIANGYKEVFDDSGTFPVGEWLEEFCMKMKINGRNKKIKIGCNMKPVNIDYKMMADAGFRFILVGVESANQHTLDKIQKGQKADKTIEILKKMSEAGLYPHLTSMFGYEWETEEDAKRTLKMIHYLLRKGYVKTAQASVYSPPRTKPNPNSIGHKYVPMVYNVLHYPDFWYNKIKDIRCWEDFAYLIRGGRLVIEEKWRKFWRKSA